MKISVGPIPYYWPAARVHDFYAELADTRADCIYLGETVCSKRRELGPADWLALARELHRAGKEVVLSTLALIEAGSELSLLRRLVENGDFRIEANDLAAVQVAASLDVPFVAGPMVNIYNGRVLSILARQGLYRWVPPVEVSRDDVAGILAEFGELAPVAVETEIFAFGHLPLAHSARCFTARFHDRPKDACGFVCMEHPEGLRARTRDDEPFLRLNGIQVQSDAVHCLQDIGDLRALGADRIRLSPTASDFIKVVNTYCAWAADEPAELPELAGLELVDGYWRGQPGMSSLPGG